METIFLYLSCFTILWSLFGLGILLTEWIINFVVKIMRHQKNKNLPIRYGLGDANRLNKPETERLREKAEWLRGVQVKLLKKNIFLRRELLFWKIHLTIQIFLSTIIFIMLLIL